MSVLAESDVDTLMTFGLPDEVIADFKSRERETRLVRTLISLRQQAGLSQEELAETVGWELEQVQRIESNSDWKLRMSRVETYLSPLGYRLNLAIEKKS